MVFALGPPDFMTHPNLPVGAEGGQRNASGIHQPSGTRDGILIQGVSFGAEGQKLIGQPQPIDPAAEPKGWGPDQLRQYHP